jgi:predicted ATPase
VIGRESSLGLLRQVASHPDRQLEQMVADLQAGEFIYEQPATTGVEYVFKHALTQEVAYNSMLIERRKQLHERTGRALETMFADRLDDHLSVLAHHYSHSDNIDKAIDYLGRAGQQAIERSAYPNAISSLNSAIALLQKLPDTAEHIQREVGLQLALGSAFFAARGWAAAEAGHAHTRARELCERLRDPPELFRALLGLWAVYFIRGEFRTAHELARSVLRRAEGANDPILLMFGHSSVGLTLFNMGEFVLAREQIEMAIVPYDAGSDRPATIMGLNDAGVPSLTHEAFTLWHLGYPDQALTRANQAVALAREMSHSFSLAMAENWVGRLHLARREASAAQNAAERLMAISSDRGFTFWFAAATTLRGGAMAEQGRTEDGIAQIQEGLASHRALGAQIGRPYWLCLLAKAYSETVAIDNGLTLLNEALTTANEQGGLHYEAEIHRLKGELLQREDDSKTAEIGSCFQRAIEIARKQSAKSLELRATMSLARLLAIQGRRWEARAMLADIYNWFTEGFDTPDLKDAKALLDELRV